MPDITFVYRVNDDSRKIFQENRPWFLYKGQVTPDDGIDVVASSDGVTFHNTSSRVVRPLAFFDPSVGFRTSMIEPGTNGFVPLNFRKGRVSVVQPRTSVVLTTSSTVHQFVAGRVGIVSQDTLGSLTDFSIFASTLEDPQQFYVETATDLDSGGVTQAWTRNSAVFVPHRNTRYVGVGARVLSVPATGLPRVQYFRKWMLEKAYIGGSFPSTYGKAREVVVKIKPDRLNLATNPSAEVDLTDVIGANVNVTRDGTWHAGVGAWSFKLLPTGASNDSFFTLGGDTGAMRLGMKAGKTYTVSATVNTPTALTGTLAAGSTRRIQFYWRVGAGAYQSVLSEPGQIGSVSNVSVTATLPAGTTEAFIRFYHGGQVTTEAVYWDNILIERTDQVLPYFDGSTSGDTVWETGGVVGKTRSYLYVNRAERYAAIKRLLSENVPMGIGIADPQFGVLPADW